MFRVPATIAATISLLLAGCAPQLGPLPKLAQPSQKATSQTFASNGAAWPAAQWWLGFGDQQLDALIAEALASAPDVTIAAARLRQAQALAEQAGSAALPSVSGEASAGAQKQSYNNGIPQQFVPKGINAVGRVALNFKLDLDLWGRNRALLSAATSEAQAAQVDLDQARLMLATSITAAYVNLSGLFAEQDVLQRGVILQGATRDLVALRVADGHDTMGQLDQARSAVSASKVQLAQISEQIELTRNQLASLTGAGPDRGRTIERPQLVSLPMALPADAALGLIGRRPDIVASRLRAEAASRRIDAAHADFYPNISLTGILGLQSLGLGNLFKGSSSIGSFGPALSLPIFDGGGLKGRYRQARGVYDEAVGSYDRTLTTALREVADAVVSRRAVGGQLGDALAAQTEAQNAYRIAQLRYRGGLSTYLDVLSAEQNLLVAQRAFADVGARRFALDIALIKSLGGGFETPALFPAAELK